MSPQDLMTALASLQDDWRRELPRILDDQLFYVDIGRFGHDAFQAVQGGACMEDFFATIERALVAGDKATRDLVVVGLFEAMQNRSFAAGPADLVEARLGPASAIAWADLIEGWTGTGVRSVRAWRAVAKPAERS